MIDVRRHARRLAAPLMPITDRIVVAWLALAIVLFVLIGMPGGSRIEKEMAENRVSHFVENLRHVDAMSALSTLSALDQAVAEGEWDVVEGQDGAMISKAKTTLFAPSWMLTDLPSALQGLVRTNSVQVYLSRSDGQPRVVVWKRHYEEREDSLCQSLVNALGHDPLLSDLEIGPDENASDGSRATVAWQPVARGMTWAKAEEFCGTNTFKSSQGLTFRLASRPKKTASIGRPDAPVVAAMSGAVPR